MRIFMLETRRGTEDGFTVRLYHENTAYDVTDWLASHFIANGCAIAEFFPLPEAYSSEEGAFMATHPNRALSRETEPLTEPLSLAEAKLYLRVDGAAEDSVITDMITTVREAAEEFMRKSLMTQRWKLVYDDYAPVCIMLPRGPVQSIICVKTRTRTGEESDIDADFYYLNGARDTLYGESVLLSHQVEIVYETGFGGAQDVPSSIRQGMLIHLVALYDNRLSGTNLPQSAAGLYAPYREVRL